MCLTSALANSNTAFEQLSSNHRDSVTCSLEDYQELFRKARQHELEQSIERQRLDMNEQMDRKEKELKDRSDRERSDAAKRVERRGILSDNWQLVSHFANGACRMGQGEDDRSFATYNVTLEFRIFDEQWTSIPLIDTQTIVSDWSIARASDDEAGKWQSVVLGRDTFLTEVARPQQADEEEPWKDHTLVTNVTGMYRLTFQAHVHVRSNRQLHGLNLNFLYPITETHLRVYKDSEMVNIRELSVEPSAFLKTHVERNYTDIEIRLPSSRTLGVKWRMQTGVNGKRLGETKQADAQKEPKDQQQTVGVEDTAQASVVHDSLHSIDDSILTTVHSFKYHMDSEQSLNNVEIHFPGAARITSVVAHSMATWRSSPFSNTTVGSGAASSSSAASSSTQGTIVNIAFKSSVIAKEVIVMIATETEFDNSAATVSVPVAICQGVLRQTGTMAIEKVANVEVYEKVAVGAARLGVEAVPSHIVGRTNRPIVLAYKFFAPRHNVDLTIIHHEELDTLEAVVDVASFTSLVLESQMMQQLLMVLQNTQRQYIEIKGVPAAATLWSTRVNSINTKPVRGANGTILVPLMVASGGRSIATTAKTSVELAWLTPINPLGDNGTVVLDPPRVDLPVSALNVEIYFPEKYTVSFVGTLRNVSRFSHTRPSPVNYETGDEVVTKDFAFTGMPPTSKAQAKTAGVKAKIPREGHKYLLEELFIVNGSARLAANYGQPIASSRSWSESIVGTIGNGWR